MKIKQIAEDLRALAVKRDMLVISATQINRGAWDATEVRMENIAESAGLAHTADVMYALIQDSVMHSEREYWLKVLKTESNESIADVIKDSDTNTLDFLRGKYKSKK